jgi:hypothetical protein
MERLLRRSVGAAAKESAKTFVFPFGASNCRLIKTFPFPFKTAAISLTSIVSLFTFRQTFVFPFEGSCQCTIHHAQFHLAGKLTTSVLNNRP